MSEVTIVAVVGFVATIASAALQPWIESQREKRRDERQDLKDKRAPYYASYRALAMALAEIDQIENALEYGSATSDRLFANLETLIGDGRAHAIEMAPFIAPSVAETADAIRFYHRMVLTNWRGQKSDGQLRLAKQNAHERLAELEQKCRAALLG